MTLERKLKTCRVCAKEAWGVMKPFGATKIRLLFVPEDGSEKWRGRRCGACARRYYTEYSRGVWERPKTQKCRRCGCNTVNYFNCAACLTLAATDSDGLDQAYGVTI